MIMLLFLFLLFMGVIFIGGILGAVGYFSLILIKYILPFIAIFCVLALIFHLIF